MKKVILAKKAGFCIGVDRAFKAAIERGDNCSDDIFTFGQLIHNEEAVEFLRGKGVFAVDKDSVKELDKDSNLIIRAHGLGEAEEKELRGITDNLIDCTCFYVKKIHKIVREYYEKGYQIVVIGDKNHVEVIGIDGWCNNSAFITRNPEEVPSFDKDICVVAQTTEKHDVWYAVLNAIKAANPDKELVVRDTICLATKERQDAVQELSQKVDAMIVIGGKKSSNTKKLYDICIENCENTQLVGNHKEIKIEPLKCVESIGVTAGASTPEWVIEEALKFLREL